MLSFTFLVALLMQASMAVATVLPPSQDPFYKAPDNFKDVAPGTILRQRHAPGNLTAVFKCRAAYNIVYRTTDAHHQPAWAVTTVLVPNGGNTTSGNSLLSYQIHYNTPNVDMSPSFALYNPDVADMRDIGQALAQGWYVNVPDYEGPNAAFGVSVASGFATLDSVRAALKKCCGLRGADTRTALWGYAGGTLASETAAELQVIYAPELQISGVALGGLISNTTDLFAALNRGRAAGLIVLGLLGFGNEYPAVQQAIGTHLKADGPFNKTGFLAGLKMNQFGAFAAYFNQDIWQYFDNGAAMMHDPALQQLLNDNGYMGYQGTPKVPFYVYKAIQDEITPIGTTDALISRYCGVGASILYERNTIGMHVDEEVNGNARAFGWLTKALGGTLGQTGCVIRDVSVNVTQSSGS